MYLHIIYYEYKKIDIKNTKKKKKRIRISE